MALNHRTRRQQKSAPSRSAGPPWVLIGGLTAVVALAAVVLYPRASAPTEAGHQPDSSVEATETADETDDTPSRPVIPTRAASPAHPSDVPLPALPLVPNMVPRAPEVIRAAYTFAAYNPDVLEYVPCFCGCESAGHTGNADCFVSERNADGAVREWENHGMACLVCIDVARDAMQLHASGGSVRDIRSAVVANFASRSRLQTPTPEPPPSQ